MSPSSSPQELSHSLRPARGPGDLSRSDGLSQREVWNAEEGREAQQLLGSSCVLAAARDALIYNISMYPHGHPLGVLSLLDT